MKKFLSTTSKLPVNRDISVIRSVCIWRKYLWKQKEIEYTQNLPRTISHEEVLVSEQGHDLLTHKPRLYLLLLLGKR